MNIEELRDFCLALGGVTEKTPFGKFARRYDSLLVFYVLDHMFCMADMDNFTSVTVKSTAEEIIALRMDHSSALTPHNPALRLWLELELGGDLTDSEIFDLVARSYAIVKAKYTPKTKRLTKRCKKSE